MSAVVQPELGTAWIRQGSWGRRQHAAPETRRRARKERHTAHCGTLDKSWAPVRASEAAKATMVAWKRMMVDLVVVVE